MPVATRIQSLGWVVVWLLCWAWLVAIIVGLNVVRGDGYMRRVDRLLASILVDLLLLVHAELSGACVDQQQETTTERC